MFSANGILPSITFLNFNFKYHWMNSAYNESASKMWTKITKFLVLALQATLLIFRKKQTRARMSPAYTKTNILVKSPGKSIEKYFI